MSGLTVHAYDSIDSTSLEAKRLLEGGQRPPFLVFAKEQSGGRGRTGRSWQSPVGNLYLTVVTPQSEKSGSDHGLIPLQVAYLLASWIQYKWSLRVTIKWPNDILFATKKIAGILCETYSDGQGMGPLIVGVGLNIHKSPAVDQETSAIGQLRELPKDLDFESLAQDLGRYLSDGLDQTFEADYCQSFSIEQGQVWSDGSKYLSQGQISGDGQLCLEDRQQQVRLNNTHHGFRWLYQDPKQTVLVGDAGNTSFKIGAFADGQEPRIVYLSYDEEIPKGLKEELAKLCAYQPWPIHVGAVARDRLDQVKALIQALGLSYVPIPKRSVQVNFDSYNFKDIGVDRVALAEAAARIGKKECGKIALSLGTASTVEVVDSKDRYLGGWILPGLQTGLTALHEKTALLPKVQSYGDQDWKGQVLGSNTKTAMKHGALWSAAYAIQGLKAQLEKDYPGSQWQILVTGGEGERLASLLDTPFMDSLIVTGLKILATGGRV